MSGITNRNFTSQRTNNTSEGTNSTSSGGLGGTIICAIFAVFSVCMFVWHCRLKKAQLRGERLAAEAQDELDAEERRREREMKDQSEDESSGGAVEEDEGEEEEHTSFIS